MPAPTPEKLELEMSVHLENGDDDQNERVEQAEQEARKRLETKLRHKFDARVLPIGIVVYLMAQIDRSNMSNAAVLGIKDDLDLTGNRFNIALTIFFVAYIAFEIPANMMCKRFGPRIWIAFITFSFDVTTTCMSLCKSYSTLLLCRFLLGLFESGVQPGLMFAYAQFYRRHELGSRWGIKAAGGSVAGAFGGLLGSGLGNIPQYGIFTRWRWIFLIEGLVTVLVGGMVFWFMPNDTASASFLTVEERTVAIERIASENKMTGADDDLSPWRWDVMKQAAVNLNTQLVGLGIMMSLLSLTSLSLFMPSLLKAMGYSTTHSQLLTVPPYVFSACVCIGTSFVSDRLHSRGIPIMILTPLTCLGFLLMAFVPSTAVRYFALFLATAPAFTCSPLLLTWVVSNAAGPSVRAIVSAYAVGEGNVGAIIATWTYLPNNGPRYLQGHAINFGGSVILLAVTTITFFYLKWENKVRAQGRRDHRLLTATQEDKWRLGHRHPEFKYTA